MKILRQNEKYSRPKDEPKHNVGVKRPAGTGQLYMRAVKRNF